MAGASRSRDLTVAPEKRGDSAPTAPEQIRSTLRFVLPPSAKVAVVTQGKGGYLVLEGRETWAIPRDRKGAYAGPYPRNDGDAIAQVEAVRAEGAQFLLFPKDALWWLDHYEGLRRHLAGAYRVVFRDPEICLIVALHRDTDPEAEGGAPDGLPLPPPEMMALTTESYWARAYWETGRSTSETIRRTLSANGLEIESFESVLDFGCGCGRVMRCWKDLAGPRLFGVDYNPYLVEWCRHNLPFARFRPVLADGHLPFDDEEFDFIYAYSVFTHLVLDAQRHWIGELQRVLRPGGHAYLTLRGKRHTDVLSPDERARFDAGEMIVKAERVSGSNACLAHHPVPYVRESLAPELELVDHVPSDGANPQADEFLDVALFRKP